VISIKLTILSRISRYCPEVPDDWIFKNQDFKSAYHKAKSLAFFGKKDIKLVGDSKGAQVLE
jgi:hypothetical protein